MSYVGCEYRYEVNGYQVLEISFFGAECAGDDEAVDRAIEAGYREAVHLPVIDCGDMKLVRMTERHDAVEMMRFGYAEAVNYDMIIETFGDLVCDL